MTPASPEDHLEGSIVLAEVQKRPEILPKTSISV